MGPYNLPRNVKGEGRILFVFSTKALIYTTIGATLGILLNLLFSAVGLGFVGIICIVLFALIGFAIGTLKVPDTTAFEITKKTGGENIDDVLKRLIKFKMKKNKIYTYPINNEINKGGNKDE